MATNRPPRRAPRRCRAPNPKPCQAETPSGEAWREAEQRVNNTTDRILDLAERVAPGGGFLALLDAAWQHHIAKHGHPPFDPSVGLSPGGAPPNLDNLHEFIRKTKMMCDAIVELADDHGVPLGPSSTSAARTIEDGGLEPERPS